MGTPIKISAASRPVAESVVAQIKDGNRSIIGLMIESNIHEAISPLNSRVRR